MKKFFNLQSLLMICVCAGFMVLAAGSDEPISNDTDPNVALGIPGDEEAGAAPEVTNQTGNIPNPAINVGEQDGHKYLTIDLTGIWDDNAKDWLDLAGTADPTQNIWVDVDDQHKGIDVTSTSDPDSKARLVDVVFLVDNSGSMYEEAEAVANSIMTWSTMLAESGLDLRVGCVGYGDDRWAVDGAFNINTAEALYQWMQNNGWGTGRTHTFGGPDASALERKAHTEAYDNGYYAECGMVALQFAHENYNFRKGSNRIYVNFTDEPNQNAGISRFSVEYLNPENGNWHANDGTVHSVFSERKDYWRYNSTNEQPWLMAEYTSGTQLFTDPYFTNFTLENLPVTGAMQNSYLIRLTNIDALFDGQQHKITITVYSKDGSVKAVKVIWFNFSEAA